LLSPKVFNGGVYVENLNSRKNFEAEFLPKLKAEGKLNEGKEGSVLLTSSLRQLVL
jgi:hypothetical protein